MKLKSKSYIKVAILSILVIPAISILMNNDDSGFVSALEYQTSTDLNFTINPSITVSLSSSDLVIDELFPGTSQDSNDIVVNVVTNNVDGYYLSGTVGSLSYASTNLVNNANSDICLLAYPRLIAYQT